MGVLSSASGITFENGRITSIKNSDFNAKTGAIEPEEDYFLEDYSDKKYSNQNEKLSEKIIDLKGKTVIPGFCVSNADFLNLDSDSDLESGLKYESESEKFDNEIINVIKNNVEKIPSKGITELWLDLDGENALRISEILFDEAYDLIPFRLRINFRFNSVNSLEEFLATGLRTGDGRGFMRIGAVSVGNRISPNDKRIIIETAHMAGMQVILEYNKPLLKSLNWVTRKFKKTNPRHLIINPVENENLFDDMRNLGFGGICDLLGNSNKIINSAFQNGIVINASAIPENAPDFFKSPLETFGELANNGLTMAEILSLYTWNAAWNGKVENRRGEIALGNDADLVVLERDPFLVHPDEAAHIKIAMTFCAGKMTYCSKPELPESSETNLQTAIIPEIIQDNFQDNLQTANQKN